MALIDKFSPTADPNVASHNFATLLTIASNGVIGDAATARARIISTFNLETSDEAQLDLIIAAITTAATDEAKYKIIRDLEDSLIAYEQNLITKAEAISNLNIS